MLREPDNVQYFAAVMYNPSYITEPDEIIGKLFGDPVFKSASFHFDHTSYYMPEMGSDLIKYFVAFGEPKDPGMLPELKRASIDLENNLAVSQKRIINIDPGYLALEKVVVASTKNFTHRVYLDKWIYGDIQLMRQKSSYRGFPWTYPDYLRQEALDFFTMLSFRVWSK